MPSNVTRVLNALASSGNLNTLVAGTVTGMIAVPMNPVQNGTLAAELTTLAETNTLTITPKWQVSKDGTNWLDVAPNAANGAYTIQSTGTGGADAAVTRVIEAPAAVYAYPYARIAITNGVATGASADTYSNVYSWVRPPFI